MLSNKSTTGGNVTFVSLKSPKGEVPYFCTQKKNEAGKWVEDERYTSVTGQLDKVAHDTYEYEGQTKDKVKFEFVSEGGAFVVEANLTMITRSMINALANADLNGINDIEITLGQNKKGYGYAYMEEGGEKLEWKYAYDSPEIPKPVQIEVPGSAPINNYHDQNQWFIKLLLEEVGGKLNKQSTEATSEAPTDPFADDTAKEKVADLPFA